MLVGKAWALDSAQEETRLGCDLPSVPTYSVSPEFANAPLTYQPVPNPADFFTAGWGGQIAELFPDEVKNAAVMFGNFAATIDTKDKVLQAFPELRLRVPRLPQSSTTSPASPTGSRSPSGSRTAAPRSSTTPASRTRTCRTCSTTPPRSTTDPIWLTDSNDYLQSFADWNATGNGDNVYCARRSRPSSRPRTTRPPSSTSTSSRTTAATSASSASRRPRRSCCGPRRPRRAAPS